MADEQDRPDEPREATPPAVDPSQSGSTPPAKHSPAKPAKKVPAKAAKKAPAKAAKAAKATKGTKATAKKAAKKAPPPPPRPLPPPPPKPALEPPALAETNGEAPFGAADETAAHARQAVDTAGDSLAGGISRVPGTGAAIPIAVALAVALLAILVIRRLLSDD
jgi:hypothetical protein